MITEAVPQLPLIYVAPPSGDTSGATDAVSITNAISALNTLAAGKGVLQFRAGAYYDNTARDFHGTTSITIAGLGGLSSGAQPATSLTYTGSAARYLNAQSSNSFRVEDIMVLANNAGFTGNLIDLAHDATLQTDSSYWRIEDCYLSMTATNAGAVVYLDQAINGAIAGNNIVGGKYGVQGIAVAGHYSNAVTIHKTNRFSGQGTAAISGPGQGWEIAGNDFEMTNGNAAITQGPTASQGGSVAGNWFGDTTGSPTVIQAGNAMAIRGNYIGGNANSTGVDLSNTTGAVVQGNTFAAHTLGINIAATSVDFDIFPNYYNGTTTKYTAPTVAVGAAAGSGGSAAIAGSDTGGRVSVTCGASGEAAGVIATVTLAGSHPIQAVTLAAGSAGAQADGAYISAISNNSFTIAVANAPAASSSPVFFYSLVRGQ